MSDRHLRPQYGRVEIHELEIRNSEQLCIVADPTVDITPIVEQYTELFGQNTAEALDAAHDFLERRQLVQRMIVTKGEQGKRLQLVIRAVEHIATFIHREPSTVWTSQDFSLLLREGVPGMGIAEWLNAQFHFYRESDPARFQQLEKIAEAFLRCEDIQPLEKANIHNFFGSFYQELAAQAMKKGKIEQAKLINQKARTYNNAGIQLLREAFPNSSAVPSLLRENVQWQFAKHTHCSIDIRKQQLVLSPQKKEVELRETYHELIQRIDELEKSRMQLGDGFMGGGRTEMGKIDLLRAVGQEEEAYVVAQRVLGDLQTKGYASVAVRVAATLADIQGKNFCNAGRARRTLVHGIGLGEQMRNIIRNEIEELERELETMKHVRPVLLVAEDKVLVEKTSESLQWSVPEVDYEKASNYEEAVRRKLTDMVNHMAAVISPADQQFHREAFSRKNARVFRLDNYLDVTLEANQPAQETPRHVASVDVSTRGNAAQNIRNIQSILSYLRTAALDKTVIDGYGILSLQKALEQCDDRSTQLIQAELQRRNSR